MKFIYFINVVDCLHTLLIIMLSLFGVCAAVRGIYWLVMLDSFGSNLDKEEEAELNQAKGKMWKFIWAFLGTFFLFCFVPAKQTMYEIFGIGVVIDYVQDNENVKAIPDKCIEAVNLWLDEKKEELQKGSK